MKLKTIILSLLLFAFLLSACNNNSSTDSTGHTAPPDTVETTYNKACNKLYAEPDRILTYEYRLQRSVGSDVYTEQIIGTDSYCDVGTDHMQALINQTLQYGTYQTEYTESFVQNTSYCSVNGSRFASPVDAATFLSRQLPAVLINHSLYGSITSEECEEGTLLTFSQPTALETWVTSYAQAELISASATAVLDTDGQLCRFTYEASYNCGSTAYQLSVESELMFPLQLDLSAAHPEYPEGTPVLAYLGAPKHLLQAVGDLFTAQSISAQISQNLDSKVYTLTQTQESDLHYANTGTSTSALWNTSLTLTDYRGDPAIKTQSDRFVDGILTRTVNGELQPEETQTGKEIRIKWENQILNGFFALNYLSNATVTDTGDALVLSFSGNDAYCAAVSASFRSVMPNDLESLASSYETSAAGGFLTIDKATGLPIAMGMEFSRTHVIDGIAYPVNFSLSQTLKLSDSSTLEALVVTPQ